MVWSAGQYTEVSAYDFRTRQPLSTEDIIFQGQPLTRLAPDMPFKYLGFRFTVTGSWEQEMLHILQSAQDLKKHCSKHPYPIDLATKVIEAIQEARFRYSAALVPWTRERLRSLFCIWRQNFKAAATISQSTANCANLPLREDTPSFNQR